MKIGLKTFEECIEKVSYRIKVRHTDYLAEGKFPVVSQEFSLINGYWNQESDVFNVKKPIIVFGDHTRVLKYIDFSFVLGADGIKIIKPKDFIDSKFFYYFLQANPIKSKGYARHYKFFKKLNLFVPPLQIQQKIVVKLDKIFSEIDKASAGAETNIKNAEALFQSFLKELYKGDKNWPVKKLGELLKIQNGYAFDSKLFSPDGLIPLIRIRDIKKGIETETRYSGNYDKKYIVKKGDFLIGMDGEFGCYEWKGDNALLNQRVCRLQNFENQIYPRFLLYGINSYLKAIERVTGFTTVKHISSKQIANIEFPFPPLQIQQKIVSKINKILSEVSKLNNLYKNKLSDFVFFKNSILKQAFNGELVKTA